MANPQHLALLKKSVAEWNQWRKEKPQITPDLRWANLQGINLRGANLVKANLEGTNLSKTILVWTNLRFANLRQAKLQMTDFRGARNLASFEINSVKSLDYNTRLPDYLDVEITGENEWTCRELK